MLMVSGKDEDCNEQQDRYIDDIPGMPLIKDLVVQARGAEMQNFRNHDVYAKSPISECIRLTSKQPIGSKWIDIKKLMPKHRIIDPDWWPRRSREG